MWTLYIIKCQDGLLYTGITEDIGRRLREHTHKGSHFTSYNPASALLYTEKYSNQKEAEQRETQIKRWSRAKKSALVSGNKQQLRNLSKSRD